MSWFSIQRQAIIRVLRSFFSENRLGTPVWIESIVVSISDERTILFERVWWLYNLCSFVLLVSFKSGLRSWSFFHFMLDWTNFFISNIKKVSDDTISLRLNGYFRRFFHVKLSIILSNYCCRSIRYATFKMVHKISVVFRFCRRIILCFNDSLNNL